jgi:hypothetical protein
MVDSGMMDVGRDRERSPGKGRQRITAKDVKDHEVDMFNLKALGNIRTWRALPLSDR